MIKECSQKLQLNDAEAEERVERYLAELQYFLSTEYEARCASKKALTLSTEYLFGTL